jgi:hypothetical protein
MHRLDENGFMVFTYPGTNSVLDTVKDFKQALNNEQDLRAIYGILFQVPRAFFDGKGLWDKISNASKLSEFQELYKTIKHDMTLGPLWKYDCDWHCFIGVLHYTTAEDSQWICHLTALQSGKRVENDLIFFTYIRYSIWAGSPE